MKVSLPIGYALIVLALFALASVQPALAATTYTIKDLGTLGGTVSVANAISSTGQAVGQASNGAGTYFGFECQSSTLVSTGLLSGGSGSTATGVNTSGAVVGSATDRLGYSHAFTCAGGGAMQSLSGISGGVNSYAMSINSSGEVAGYADNALGSKHVVVWINRALNDLGTLGGWSAVGESVNDSGHVAGYSYIPGNAATHALYWDGSMHDLGTLGGTNSYAYGVNSGNVVVGWSYTSGNTARHGFYWNGAMHDIGALSNSYSYAYGVNSSGQIVGQSAGAAFLYSSGVITNLNTLLPANSGWTLSSANGINESGQIVGWGIINGQVHAYMMSPPVTQPAQPPPPPAAPIGLSATSSTGQNALNWSTSAGATSYNLYRATTSGAETLYKSGLAATAYTDTGLTNGSSYYYEVTAVGTSGESARSNEASATPTAPAPGASAVFVKQDTATSGNWKGVYGADGFDILTDPSANNPAMPAYATLAPAGNSTYQWAAPGSTTAGYALQQAVAGSTSRLAGVWYSATSFSLDLNLTDGKPHQVALYALDWLSANRGETITISDAASGAVLDSRAIKGFGKGYYEVYNISGHVKISITKTSGNNCVVSGIFFK